MTFRRRTLRASVRLSGCGLHSGRQVDVTIHPWAEGIAFRCGSNQVQALPENVSDTTRCTTLGGIGTIEHAMSAFAGLEVTDALVELTAPEMPGLDGSARPYVDALTAAGLDDLGDLAVPEMFARIFFADDGAKVAVAKGTGHWRYVYEAPDRWPGEQAYETCDAIADYADQIAPSRTFALAEEIPAIMQAGLGQGLDEHSALIVGIEGYKNEPRFPDEPARHKLLDLLGDLYLAGVPVRALNVVAERSGHRANVKAAHRLRQALLVSTP
jgi:UDP-3-O-[3-hydroxymyristoyl] N-acetylglucosamine deacetylase